MNIREIEDVFATDSEGKYIKLIIPATADMPKMDLSGKRKLELSLDEIVRLKKYAHELYSNIEE